MTVHEMMWRIPWIKVRGQNIGQSDLLLLHDTLPFLDVQTY